MELYDFLSYKKYLNYYGEKRWPKKRGFRSALAREISCQPSYMTAVLDGNSDLSLEQAEAANLFLHHSQTEAEYFLTLVDYERAGTPALRARIRRRMEKQQSEQSNLSLRLQHQDVLPEEAKSRFFSSWTYATILTCLDVPRLRRPDQIARALGLSQALVMENLDFLESTGLVERKADQYRTGKIDIHLDKKSPLILQHHSGFRARALHNIHDAKETDFHYSLVCSVSHEDAQKIFQRVVNEMSEIQKIRVPSKPETVYGLNLDFYKLEKVK